MRELLLIFFFPLVASTGTLLMEFTASEDTLMTLSIPSPVFGYMINLRLSSEKKTTGYYSNGNQTSLLFKLTLDPTVETQEIRIFLKSNSTITKTFFFGTVRITMTAQFTCDENATDVWCGETPEQMEVMPLDMDVIQRRVSMLFDTLDVESTWRIVEEFVLSHYEIVTAAVIAAILIVLFCLIFICCKCTRHHKQSYDLPPVELTQFKQRKEYAIMVTMV